MYVCVCARVCVCVCVCAVCVCDDLGVTGLTNSHMQERYSLHTPVHLNRDTREV